MTNLSRITLVLKGLAGSAVSDYNHCMAHGTWDHASERV
jgi:hypothetical protein